MESDSLGTAISGARPAGRYCDLFYIRTPCLPSAGPTDIIPAGRQYNKASRWPKLHVGNSIQLVAQATDQNGLVLRVDYYEGDNRIASAFKPNFRALWRAPALGQHNIFAVAVDNHGVTKTSTPIQISVVPSNDKFSNATV